MDTLLLHPQTRIALQSIVDGNTHAILLVGPAGAGASALAHQLAAQKLEVAVMGLDTHAYFLDISPTDGSISIDEVRKLQRFLQLKTTGKPSIRRVIVINEAGSMTLEAQNALLKSLEEPPTDTVIILTTASISGLRPTILSRVQRLEVLPVSQTQADKYFSSVGFSKDAIDKAYTLSKGHVGLLTAILEEKTEHPLLEHIRSAKSMLTKTTFERVAAVEGLSKQKEQLPDFLSSCRLVCGAALAAASKKSDSKMITRWANTLETIYKAEAALSSNPNQKLLLTNLMLNL